MSRDLDRDRPQLTAVKRRDCVIGASGELGGERRKVNGNAKASARPLVPPGAKTFPIWKNLNQLAEPAQIRLFSLQAQPRSERAQKLCECSVAQLEAQPVAAAGR